MHLCIQDRHIDPRRRMLCWIGVVWGLAAAPAATTTVTTDRRGVVWSRRTGAPERL